jgi:hypothetical protein
MNKATTTSWHRSPVIWVLIAAAISLTWISSNSRWNKSWQGIIRIDGMGYYAYLPAILIYQDPTYSFLDSLMREVPGLERQYQPFLNETPNGKVVNKYFIGTALLQTPFFLLGHLVAQLTNAPTHGYAKPYYYLFHLGNIIYTILGCLALAKLLRFYGTQEKWTAWIIVATIFATNLSFYVVGEPSMSHVFSFSVIAWFAWATKSWIIYQKNKYLGQVSLLLGIAIVIRPINVLIILSVPFLAGSWTALIKSLQAVFLKPKRLPLALIPMLGIVSIQLIAYYWQTETWFVYSYGQEGFDFSDPHLFGALFSYRKGLFVYVPGIFLTVLAALWLIPACTFSMLTWYGFLFVVLFVISSWHDWGYGGGYSIRPMIDYYAFFAIPLKLVLESIQRKWVQSITYILLFLLITFTQIQTFQYRKSIIHYSEMNKEMYWERFLRINRGNQKDDGPTKENP